MQLHCMDKHSKKNFPVLLGIAYKTVHIYSQSDTKVNTNTKIITTISKNINN